MSSAKGESWGYCLELHADSVNGVSLEKRYKVKQEKEKVEQQQREEAAAARDAARAAEQEKQMMASVAAAKAEVQIWRC